MFYRKKYKKYARIQLKNRLLIPALAALIYCFIYGTIQAPEIYNLITRKTDFATSEGSGFLMEVCSIVEACILFIAAFAQLNLHLKMSRSPEKVHFSDLLEGYSYWGRAILCGLWEALWTFLWTLLFIIPGLIKHYSYSMTKFLALEYPKISVGKALKISMIITRGHKADIFVTDLSFIGWTLLSFATGGILFLWTIPYYIMTMTNIYHALLTEAIETHRIKPEDLLED